MRPAVEDTEKRMKEEKRIKRQAKEEEVLMKKEMILKASAEETKRYVSSLFVLQQVTYKQ